MTLARARLRDAEDADLDEQSHGWVYQDELASMLRTSRNQLNLQVFRARKQLADLGVPGAHGLVERRLDSRQVRIGVGRLSIEAG